MLSQRFFDKSREKDEEYLKNESERMEKKQRRIIRSMFEPVIPVLCKRLYQCMIIFTVLGVAVVFVTVLRNREEISEVVSELILTASVTWSGVGMILIVLSLVQLLRLEMGFEELTYYFADELDEKEISKCRCVSDATDKPGMVMYAKAQTADAVQRYKKYVQTALVGTVLFGVLLLEFGSL